MIDFAVLLALVATAGAAAAVVARRRRGAERSRGLAPRLGPGPAGVRHLAASVSELSDVGLHLPAPAAAASRKARLGTLLGLR